MNQYTSIVCDEFSIFTYTNTKLDLPSGRETILHFFDSLQKSYPRMTEFDCREANEYVLEEDHDEDPYRWAAMEPKRFSSGFVNPPSLEEADKFHERILEVAPYHLDFHPFDCDALDVVFAFDLMYKGNHDEIVAEALGLHPALESLTQSAPNKVLNFQPSLLVSLDEACQLQCRLNIETRTNPFQVRTGEFTEAPISVYFTVRQYWENQPFETFQESYRNQRRICQEMVEEYILDAVVNPVAHTISAHQ